MDRTKWGLERSPGNMSIYKWVKYPSKTQSHLVQWVSVLKEEHELTNEDRAHRKQMDVDWLWWVFMWCDMSIVDIAKRLGKDEAKVKAMIDRIIKGEQHLSLEELEQYASTRREWTERQKKILIKMRAAHNTENRIARCLSRSMESLLDGQIG